MPSSKRSSPAPSRKPPALNTKKQPAQQRSTETYERILEITALTLSDVGIERLSTNLVCERAGLTPPALYRYFPNKYAILNELGRRLMELQNERIDLWITADLLARSTVELERALEELIIDTYAVTKAYVGGVWIMRALRAVPALQQLRLDSHDKVARLQAELLSRTLPSLPRQEVQRVSRISVELIYAAVEMLFDTEMELHAVAKTVACMIASHRTRVEIEAAVQATSRRT